MSIFPGIAIVDINGVLKIDRNKSTITIVKNIF